MSSKSKQVELIEIPAGDIECRLDDNARQDFTFEKILEDGTGVTRLRDHGFVEDIRRRWVMQPPHVRSVGKNTYAVVYGFRRVLAAQQIDPSRPVLCTLQAETGAKGDQRALLDNFRENEQRNDLRPFEKAEAIYRLRKRGGLTNKQIADELGMSESHCSNLYNLRARASEFIWELYRRHGDEVAWEDMRQVLKHPKAEQEGAWETMRAKKKNKPGPKPGKSLDADAAADRLQESVREAFERLEAKGMKIRKVNGAERVVGLERKALYDALMNVSTAGFNVGQDFDGVTL